MARLRWVKGQDFYLRLGLLKVLVAALSTERTSVANEAIYRRITKPLAEPAKRYRDLWREIQGRVPWHDGKHSKGDFRKPSVTETLLILGDCPSFLQTLTPGTVYKVLDWGHDLELVGRGNQITERGLILRSLLPMNQASAFLAGEPLAWNPFRLTTVERLFFLFHITELDSVTARLICSLGSEDTSTLIGNRRAGQIICTVLFDMLDDAKDNIHPNSIPRLQAARELAFRIAEEMDMTDLLSKQGGDQRRKLPRPLKIGRGQTRKTTKSTDHETIPRFEQLADLGFASKQLDGEPSHTKSRRRWNYRPLPSCARWKAANDRYDGAEPFGWGGFAAAAVDALRPTGEASVGARDDEAALREMWSAYEAIKRPIGDTPFDSLALLTMIRSAASGSAVEMTQLHRMMLQVKKESLLPEHVYFSSGNALDGMFVTLRPGFLEAVRPHLAILSERPSVDGRRHD